jgi:hypothetical protein
MKKIDWIEQKIVNFLAIAFCEAYKGKKEKR